MAGGEGKKRTRRSYRPTVEVMEALRLLSSATASGAFPGLVAEHNVLGDHGAGTRTLGSALPSISGETWDAALLDTHLGDLLSGSNSAIVSPGASTPTSDPAALSSGLAQLNKYLSRSWYRAGIPVQMHDDCSQVVYATMLQQLGRTQFDVLISDVGHSGIKDVFSRETSEGLDFFRPWTWSRSELSASERTSRSTPWMFRPHPATRIPKRGARPSGKPSIIP